MNASTYLDREVSHFLIDTDHPTSDAFRLRGHPVKVTRDNDGSFYCSAPKLGCSRNYRAPDASAAIHRFVAEHAMRATKIEAVSKGA